MFFISGVYAAWFIALQFHKQNKNRGNLCNAMALLSSPMQLCENFRPPFCVFCFPGQLHKLFSIKLSNVFMRWFETRKKTWTIFSWETSSGNEYLNAQSSFYPVVNTSLQPLFLTNSSFLFLFAVTDASSSETTFAFHIYAWEHFLMVFHVCMD